MWRSRSNMCLQYLDKGVEKTLIDDHLWVFVFLEYFYGVYEATTKIPEVSLIAI